MRRFLLMLLGSILLFGGSVQAAERDFSVAIDTAISEQRQPSNTAYYDLLLAPGTTKELSFILTNHTDDKLPTNRKDRCHPRRRPKNSHSNAYNA